MTALVVLAVAGVVVAGGVLAWRFLRVRPWLWPGRPAVQPGVDPPDPPGALPGPWPQAWFAGREHRLGQPAL